jgi:hypothetical protein
VLDRQIKSFPSIDFREYPRGIDPINGAEITGLDSIGASIAATGPCTSPGASSCLPGINQ